MNQFSRSIFHAVALLGAPAILTAQADSTTSLAQVKVTVSREASRSVLELPFSVSRLNLDSDRRDARRASLSEVLQFVPGLSVSNRFNPTQDPRTSVRGFGARSAFGIRGIRILRDGIPLTAADGQTAVDVVDLEAMSAIEVLRGSAGALYGNSSGGVMDFRTPPPPDSGGRARASGFYAGGVSRASVTGARRAGIMGLQATVTRTVGDGPRDYSAFRYSSTLADARWGSADGPRFQVQGSLYDSPDAQNPGALTLDEMGSSPTLADSLNVRRKAGKTVRQSILAFQVMRDIGRGSVSASIHGGGRDLKNPLSFAIIDLDRKTFGGSVQAQVSLGDEGRPFRLAVGADLLNQDDDRRNFANCAGRSGSARDPVDCPDASDQGAISLSQREQVSGIGAYIRGELSLTSQLSVTGTLRNDWTRFAVTDRREATPTRLSRTLSAVSPMLGVNWRVGPLSSAYAAISTSFETPTTTELANQPDGSGGLNTELQPQRGITWETGIRGLTAGGVRYDLALFRITTRDELIPFEVVGGAGRRFFRNAGRTSRVGAEAAVSGNAGPVSSGITFTWLRYRYDDFVVSGTSYAGNDVPGVSPFAISGFAGFSAGWSRITLEVQRAGRQAVDDANTAFADAYTLANARMSFTLPTSVSFEPVLGVDNIFDTTYASNVAVNASRGRYYEPGAGRTFYVSLRVGTR